MKDREELRASRWTSSPHLLVVAAASPGKAAHAEIRVQGAKSVEKRKRVKRAAGRELR